MDSTYKPFAPSENPSYGAEKEGDTEQNAEKLDKSLPLFCSDQAWEGEIKKWAGNHFPDLILEGSFRLDYHITAFYPRYMAFNHP